MPPVKTSLIPLPNGRTIETVIVELPGGRLVARTPEELIERPAPPAPRE